MASMALAWLYFDCMAQSYWFHCKQQGCYGLGTTAYFYSMHKVFVLLGSNMGRRNNFLNSAKEIITAEAGAITQSSSVYETEAWGNTNQKAFLNQVIVIRTKLSPDVLMQTLLGIEERLGRIRTQKFGPRTIDLDILFYDGLIIRSKWVTLPHPAIQERRFVLVPLVELSPRKIHPVYRQTVTTLLKNCTDTLAVKKMKQ
jgi:2-amino-4-hydroxy-6-hydroxymethyldihydropteridine diphosphokinase